MRKIIELVDDILGGLVIEMCLQSASPLQRLKWKIEDLFKR